MAMSLDEFQEYCWPTWRNWAVTATRTSIDESRDETFYTPAARRILKPRSVASIRNDHINYHAERLIAEMPEIGIVPRTIRDRAFYLLGDRVLLSFKKLDAGLVSHGNATYQDEAFLNQMPLPELGLVEEATHIIAGYTTNQMETQIQIYFTCPLGEQNLWAWRLWSTEEPANFLDLVLPPAPADGQVIGQRPKLVQVKPGVRKMREADGPKQ